jgi:Uma2 family endonuclease
MSRTLPTHRAFTIADLANFPDDGKRYEIIDGELYVSTAPHSDHQAAIGEIEAALRSWDPDKAHGWTLAGAGIVFALDTGVIPDLLWLSAARFGVALIDPATGERDGHLHAAPDLVIEALSPGSQNVARDRETKLTLYSRRGVQEYWLVDRAAQVIETYRRMPDAQLHLAATLASFDTLTSPLLPGFALPVRRVFHLPPGLPG